MPNFRKVTEPSTDSERFEKIALDERFISQFITETPLDRVEAQELRQVMLRALQSLTRYELRVVELRFQHKKSPGQVASQLRIGRDQLLSLESQALEKLRIPLAEYLES